MIDHAAVLLACRTLLETFEVASLTGTISATSTGYVRASGSFLTDGFAPGMEVVGSGFSEPANNGARTITSVTALTLTCPDTTTEAAGSRTLTVGLPTGDEADQGGVASENVPYTPAQGVPYFEEQYVPGPMNQQTIGPSGELEVRPTYVVQVRVPQNTGVLGIWGYVKTLLTLFAPGTALTVTDHVVIVRRDVAPFAGQLFTLDGYAVVTVTIPLRARVANV